ncbi:uncharacterized protein [Petaurus breviceps papuanus]|uniref:uncharacterized protein n=1 Tax=Petaurus breviceps papuanus TaxID=3040969 RepID=UPI0036D95E0B
MGRLSWLRAHNPGQWPHLTPVSVLGPQIDQKLLEQVEVEGLRSKTMGKRSRQVPSLKKRPPECLGSGAKLADRRNLQKRIPFQPWTPFATIFSPLQTVKQNVPLQERTSIGEQHLGTRETNSASFLSPGTILDVISPAPHNLAGTTCRKPSGCLERETTFYLSNSSEIPLSTSLEGQTGLSLQVLSGSAALPEAQGLSLEPRTRPLSSLSGNPAEKLPSKIMLPRRMPSFKLQRKTGLSERATQDFTRPPAPGHVIGPGTSDETARAPSLDTGEKKKF